MATFSVTISPPIEDLDQEAAELLVNRENKRREVAGLVVLPISPLADLKTSAETVLSQQTAEYWGSLQKQAAKLSQVQSNVQELWRDASSAQRAAAIAALQS